MNPFAAPPQGVPTLTEVVAWENDGEAVATETVAPAPPLPVPLPVLPSEEQLIQAILGDLQRQIDLMLDYRMRELLAPLLARATDGLIRDARQELASTLRDVVARAVAQEISRHRTR